MVERLIGALVDALSADCVIVVALVIRSQVSESSIRFHCMCPNTLNTADHKSVELIQKKKEFCPIGWLH